ncbi:MAG: hypothetical protein A2Z83_07485 [Omnitrophica bacterium GWA2_52_8]|nr:MAG: hypothetical protein A2Z83_07485 [Omnitrophica bacterium GWA2_52_8]
MNQQPALHNRLKGEMQIHFVFITSQLLQLTEIVFIPVAQIAGYDVMLMTNPMFGFWDARGMRYEKPRPSEKPFERFKVMLG